MHGCYWPQPSATPEVLSVSDRDTEKEEHEVQEGQPLSSPAATDATMADEEANEAVSVHSSSSESPTIPSTEQPEEDDAHMEDDDSANTSSADEDDCLSNRPAPPEAYPAQDEMLEAEDEARSMLPPQNGEPPSSSPTCTPLSPLSNEDRGLRLVQGAQSKKLRKSLAPASRQPLGSIPEHEQPPATLADLASRNAQRQEAPVCRNPETPPDHPGATQERSHTMTEIDLAFFPRVRTPCGHGAQVIVEGREEQSDGGEKNKDHKHNPKTTTKGPQAESPPSCSLSSVLVKQVRRKRVSRKGPEFTNEKHIGAGLCSSKAAKRLQRDLTSQL